jgi:predicted dienelactone hydrolase
MKTVLVSLIIFFCTTTIIGQFAVGTRTITFNDPNRTGGFGSGGGPGRQIQCEIYYPATSAGTNVPVANGTFPVIVFGHGFAMAWDAYQNIWTEMVPKGYIMVFPRTEGGLIPGPSHLEFGKDLVIVEQHMVALGNLSSSPFYQKLSNNNAIMGHSMGGGCTMLAAENNTSIKTIIGLAPAETNPSAITASANITVPALIISGGQDGVTPPANHHLPIYNALNSACKTFVNIVGGAHCYFANTNFNCDFGESTSSSGISITRAQQHQKMYDLITPWLAFYLKEDCAAFIEFENQLNSTGITSQRTCNYSLPVVDNLQNETACGQYTLPSVTNGTYFTQSGGQGSTLNVGHQITTSQPIYLFNQSGFCVAESTAQIHIDSPVEVDNLNDVTACGTFNLPSLSVGNYYTASNGNGQSLTPNQSITSSQTIYIYAVNGVCTNESQFEVTIDAAPAIATPSDVTSCDSYTLPTLTAGNYYPATNGGGNLVLSGTTINTSQIVYVFAQNGTCTNEHAFEITINSSPNAPVINDAHACDEYVLPTITNANYFTAPNGGGDMLHVGNVINTNATLYVYAENHCGFDESSFDITITTIDNSVMNNNGTLSAVQNGATYVWVDCNNTFAPISGATKQTFAPSVNGSYAVEVTINTCTVVSECTEINGLVLNLNEMDNFSSIKIYPNPTNGTFSIDLGDILNAHIAIRDISGKIVYQHYPSTLGLQTIQLDEANGIYTVEITASNFNRVYKLVKL